VNPLLTILAGLVLIGVGTVGFARRMARSRAAEAILVARLDTLKADGADKAQAGILLGPQAGPMMLRVKFARAGMQMSRPTGLAIGAGLAATALAIGLTGHLLVAVAVVVMVLAGLLLALELRAALSLKALSRDLPAMLDAVRQHVTVGASLHQALVRAIEGSGFELRRHFQPVARRIESGAGVAESLAWLAERLHSPEIDMLSAAIQTNVRFGGAIAPTLQHLVHILRDRARVIRELKAATAETRLSGLILAGMPVAAIVGVAFLNPVYARFLFETATGHTMLIFAFGFQAMGCVAMARVMKLDF
jgi:tight adherence protein B